MELVQDIDKYVGTGSQKMPLNLTPMRRELLTWFKQNAPSLAEAYEGAIYLIEEKSFPGRIHFISHAVRDIADRLAFTLDSEIKNTRVQYEEAMDKIQKEWKSINLITNTKQKTAGETTVTIDYKVALQIDSLVIAHRKRRDGPSNYDLLFRFLMKQEPMQAQVNERILEDFKRLRRWFMDLTHLRAKAENMPQIKEDELQAKFESFERMLHSFVGNFFTGMDELDEILKQANR